MSRMFLGILLAALLSGCADLGFKVGTVAGAIASLSRPRISDYDAQNARWVRDAHATVSLRSPMFFAQSQTAAALRSACAQGKWVDVVVYAGGASEVSTLRGSCVRVFVTDSPEVGRGFDVLLLDGDTVVSEGNLLAVVNTAARQEYNYRNALRRNAQRIN